MEMDVAMRLSERLFVSKDDELDVIAGRLNAKLALQLEQRDSSYWGTYYLGTTGELKELRLCMNEDPLYDPAKDPIEDKWLEPNFPEDRMLLYIIGERSVVEDFEHRLWYSCPSFNFRRVRNRD